LKTLSSAPPIHQILSPACNRRILNQSQRALTFSSVKMSRSDPHRCTRTDNYKQAILCWIPWNDSFKTRIWMKTQRHFENYSLFKIQIIIWFWYESSKIRRIYELCIFSSSFVFWGILESWPESAANSRKAEFRD